MSTDTLRKSLVREVGYRQRRLARAEEDLARAPERLLDLEVSCHRVWAFSRIVSQSLLEIMYEVDSEEEQRELAALLMDLLGASSASREEDTFGTAAIAFFPDDDAAGVVKIFVNVPAPCDKKARVTEARIITFCGELDTSRYLTVDYLDLEDRITKEAEPAGETSST